MEKEREEAMGKERNLPVRDVFDMSLTEVGRLALVVRDCFSCAVKDVTFNGVSSCQAVASS